MKVLINPAPHEQGNGTMSRATWGNRSVIAAINSIFDVKSHEKITQIEITEDGITARFERVKCPKTK